MKEKVILAMSGGVDSSVAALLLKQNDYDVSGATFILYKDSEASVKNDPESRRLSALTSNDVRDARIVAEKMDIKHFVFDFCQDFKKNVIDIFAESYLKGETPNPCVTCNKDIKFNKIIDIATSMEMDRISTGHYADTFYDNASERFILKKAKDEQKDQSYVLYNMTQEQLRMSIFPLGSLTKEEIRRLAVKYDLINAEKPDSQDICFVKDGDYAGFLRRECAVSSKPGRFIDANGKILGEHKGIINYTIGQRKGLGISAGKPLFVIRKDVLSNNIILGENKELYSKRVFVSDVNLIALRKLDSPIKASTKLRYKQKEMPSVVHPISEKSVMIEFREGQRAVTPGQSAVFYDGDIVVGGGIITNSI